MIAPANIRITCKACNKSGYACDFTSCDKDDCQLMGRRNKNPKPKAILVGGEVTQGRACHRHCTCEKCLEVDTKTVEAALLKAGVPSVRQHGNKKRIRVSNFESPVNDDDYEKGVELRYVDAPKAVCVQIITLGKK